MTTQTVSSQARWTTPRILLAARIALIALDALLLVAVVVGAGVHRDAMKTIGQDTAPSIIHAQRIKTALADMDADAVNEFLSPPAEEAAGMKAYELRRVEAAEALIGAAGNITYGDSELKPIKTLQVGLGTYERLIQKARDRRASQQGDFLEAYREAASLMDGTLLPAADALDEANDTHLRTTYAGQSTNSFLSRAAVALLGVFALAGLVALQLFLSGRMKRTLNPLLLAASALTLALAGYSLLAMSHEQHQLKIAREDAFTSIHALLRARAVAYEANSDESRYLLDPAGAAGYEREFFTKSRMLAEPPSGMTLAQVVSSETDKRPVEDFKGYLANELNNITFDGEREPAVETLRRFAGYLTIDAQIRALEQQSGRRQDAIALCLGSKQGQSNWAFARFDDSLGRTLAVNQDAFDAAVKAGLSAVGGLEIEASAVAVLIATLIFLGISPRLREFL